MLDQRQQRQYAALAVIVGPQYEVTYFSEMSAMSAQKVSETMPSTSTLPGARPATATATEKV